MVNIKKTRSISRVFWNGCISGDNFVNEIKNKKILNTLTCYVKSHILSDRKGKNFFVPLLPWSGWKKKPNRRIRTDVFDLNKFKSREYVVYYNKTIDLVCFFASAELFLGASLQLLSEKNKIKAHILMNGSYWCEYLYAAIPFHCNNFQTWMFYNTKPSFRIQK